MGFIKKWLIKKIKKYCTVNEVFKLDCSIQKLKLLDLQPDDIVLVNFKNRTDMREIEYMMSMINETQIVEKNLVLFYSDNISFEVLKRAADDRKYNSN